MARRAAARSPEGSGVRDAGLCHGAAGNAHLFSPDLEERLGPWLEGGLTPEQAGRVERSLVRYLVRMASRCTPFGLFADRLPSGS